MALSRCIALYDYQGRDSEELTVHKNEHLAVVDNSGTWWRVRNDSGGVGLVPSNYVKGVLPHEQPQSQRTNLAEKEEPAHMYHQPDLMVQRNGPSLNIPAVAKYKYVSTRDDELSLEKGEDVIVMEKEADGWWKGRCGTRIGWFPFNYVEEVGPESSDATPGPAAATPSREKSFVCGVISLYAFNSGNPEELAFQKGDLMDIIDQPQDDPDWWEARKSDGTTGLVPRNYVEVVHDAEPVFGAGRSPVSSSSHRPAQPGPTISQASRPPPPFAHEPWFFGKVARRDAESVLNMQAQNGQFIVRESETKVRYTRSISSNQITVRYPCSCS